MSLFAELGSHSMSAFASLLGEADIEPRINQTNL